jgi:protease IV
VQDWVDSSYALFVDRVAQGRRLSRERVGELARGRVWSGQQALERGLVDKLGGFSEAIQAAKARAGLASGDDIVLDDPGKREVNVAPVLEFLPGALKSVPERTVRVLSLIGEPGTIRAALPFDLEVN